MFSVLRSCDKDVHNNSASDFIPIACHYDTHTLLTKDGKLLQVIQIKGLNAEKISDSLHNLREVIRTSIKKHYTTADIAFWIHTIRERQNLDDDTASYENLLAATFHELWREKNHWHDKFINTLYISIIHDSSNIKINNINSFINSLSDNVITNFEYQYLEKAFKVLNDVVNNILSDLSAYSAEKLGIEFKQDRAISNIISLYNRIVNLSHEEYLAPIVNLSDILHKHQYTIRADTLIITSNKEQRKEKYVSLLSLKEYQESPSSVLDHFLQLPIELIVTEIFYLVDKKQVISSLQKQDYILTVSNDQKLLEYKNIDKLNNSLFCNQQISIAIIENDQKKLEHNMAKASSMLSKLGIIHVKEDVAIEQTFWAQLPGNFSFIRRMRTPLIIDHLASFAFLHDFALGNQYNSWGKALTLLRTEKGTPYFMNFHDKTGKGHTCIFGTQHTGKTVLLNFLISEATKYEPSIVYISNDKDSQIFIEAMSGQWIEPDAELFNPFLLDNTKQSEAFVLEFLKLITNHYIIPLTEIELTYLEKLKDKIFALEQEKRIFSNILNSEDFADEGGILIKDRLKDFMQGGLYHGIFDNSQFNLSEKNILGINLYHLSGEYFTKQFYPTERKFLEQFNNNLKKHQSTCAGLIYALTYHVALLGNKPKIFAIDNLDTLYQPEIYFDNMNLIFGNLSDNNGILVSSLNFSYLKLLPARILEKLLNLINTKIILPSDVKFEELSKILNLEKRENDKLSKLLPSSRMFLINKDNEYILAELSITSLVGMVRILSSKDEEFKIYKEVLEKYQGHPDNWIQHLYDALNTQ